MQNPPGNLLKAVFIRRINRFVAAVILNNEKQNVYVPNTGRLSELALPGSEVLLSPIYTKYKFKLLYFINRSFPVMIDSTYSNRLFRKLLEELKVPMLGPYDTILSEPVYGAHRFDFLLAFKNNESFVELKSCTLFHKNTGSFPDAVSIRASEHVKALAESGKGKLVFFVLRSDIEIFIPNYHTDFLFYETLKAYKNRIDIHALTVQYDDALIIESLKEIPVIIPEVKPEGIYILTLYNASNTVDDDGEILEQGFYLYCGSAKGNIFKTITSIKRKNGLRLILPEEKFSELKIISDLPVITEYYTTGEVNNRLITHGGESVAFKYPEENTTDNHLIFFRNNPAEKSWFWKMVLELRFGEYSCS